MTTPSASSPASPLDWSADLSAIANHLVARGWLLATAESCTGGGIAAACTDVSGSSAWFDRGWVTYSNAAKSAQIGVDAALIDQFGAVSEPVARAMAIGAQRHAHTHIAIATTGIAGPTGGSPESPLVWFGLRGLSAQKSGQSGATLAETGRLYGPKPLLTPLGNCGNT